jgi:hypothetical protein
MDYFHIILYRIIIFCAHYDVLFYQSNNGNSRARGYFINFESFVFN